MDVWRLWRGDRGHVADVCAQVALEAGAPEQIQLQHQVAAVANTRQIGKADMKLNEATPRIEVDPETYEVRADGELLICEPAEVLPMAQRYFLF